jgi:LacI family transcriptional regulator
MNIRHLARLARLSPSAVSLALRDSPKISAATKAQVRRLAEQVGYRSDARVVAMMRHLRKPAAVRETACFAVMSFYNARQPWEQSLHRTRIYDGMTRRAGELGYRLEPLWLRSPGMTYWRFRGILEARGIEGLLCFGSPNFDEEFPAELSRYAIVTVGLSIRTPLHRVISDSFSDTAVALDRLHHFGYRRPGLVISNYEELRGAHKHSAAYLGWCEHQLRRVAALPILRLDQVEPVPLLGWLKQTRPDSLVFVHRSDLLEELHALLRTNGVRIPEDLGVLAISPTLAGTDFAGLQENQRLMGVWAVELLAARIVNRDLGIPNFPRIEMVESLWKDGFSLRRVSVNS